MSPLMVVVGLLAGLLLWLGGLVVVQDAPWWSRRLAVGIIKLAALMAPPKLRPGRRAVWGPELEFVQKEEGVPGTIYALRFLLAGIRTRRRRWWVSITMMVVGGSDDLAVLVSTIRGDHSPLARLFVGLALGFAGLVLNVNERRYHRWIPGPAVKVTIHAQVTRPDGTIEWFPPRPTPRKKPPWPIWW